VLEGLLSGQRVSEIARTLGLSVKTVSTHKGHIQDKFGVDSLAGLLRRVLAHDSGA
jgi:DNA-binding CsgD family transcriptional regulator